MIIDARGAPTRIPAEFPDVYGEMPGPFDPGRVPLPPTPPDATLHRLTVRPADLDPLGHVNNAAYLDYLEETVLAAGDDGAAALARAPRSVRLEYLLATVAGATPEGAAWRVSDEPDGPGGWAWRLSDEAGTDLARGRILAGTPSTRRAQTGAVHDADGVQGRVGVRRHGRGPGAGRRRHRGRTDRRRRARASTATSAVDFAGKTLLPGPVRLPRARDHEPRRRLEARQHAVLATASTRRRGTSA